jgi:hypothetical protein
MQSSSCSVAMKTRDQCTLGRETSHVIPL